MRGTGMDGSARHGVRDMMMTARVCSAGHNGGRSWASGAAVDSGFVARRARVEVASSERTGIPSIRFSFAVMPSAYKKSVDFCQPTFLMK